jgi:kynurenine 3-monooxygenase
MTDSQRIIIAGAGLSGALLACMLGKRGYRVDVYERRPDPRAKGFIGGRSINLALSTRGLDALARVGLTERVLKDAIPMRGRMMHSVGGDLTFQPYSKDPKEAINSASRGGLNLTLLHAAAAYESVTLHFGKRTTDVDLEGPAIVVQDEVSGQSETVAGAVVVGADGAFSAVRGRLQKTDRFDYSQSYLAHGYKELTIPPTAAGEFAMEPNALHIWPRGGYMMIALPNADRSFTCTCFWPHAGENGFDRLGTEDQVMSYFKERFGDAVSLMPTLAEDYRQNPVGSLVTVRCQPWHDRRAALVGDAAHAIVPFYGQGMNAAFQDCLLLDDLIERHGPDWDRVLPEYSAVQKPNGDAIADLALRNFIEMRDEVGSRLFLLRKQFEKILHRLLPGVYTPLYNLVSFSSIPYAEARRRAARQDRWVYGTIIVLALLVVFAGVLGFGAVI